MDESKEFYQELKNQRESSDITLEEISDFTKIDIKYLIAIEEGDFSVLPNVYMRLFLRSYCHYIKADAEKTLNDYQFYTLGEKPTKDLPYSKIEENDTSQDINIDQDELNRPPVPVSKIITILIMSDILKIESIHFFK